MSAQDVIPPPPLKSLQDLQLMRYTLVKLIMECKNFESIMTGCYARVLLEMRQNRNNSSTNVNAQNGSQNPSGDNYFIVKIKGVHKGPSYTGFSWDGVTTDYHILIEIPSCFRSNNPSNNYVQLNSISNSQFRPAEYDEWVKLHREANCPFQSISQLQLRFQTLQEHLHMIKMNNTRQSRSENIDPQVAAQIKDRAQAEVQRDHVLLPQIEQLQSLTADELYKLQRQCHEMMEQLRVQVYDRTRCKACGQRTSSIICYPCKHQCLCESCQDVEYCPVRKCGERILERIKPYVESS